MIENDILKGNSLDVLKTLPDKCINMVMTSPPYWALRDYGDDTSIIWDGKHDCDHNWENEFTKKMGGGSNGIAPEYNEERKFDNTSKFCSKCGAWKGQLGLEPTFDLYIKHLCDIFDEVKRVLRDDGTIFVNIGDTYYTKSGTNFENDNLSNKSSKEVSRTTGINKANSLRGKPHKYMQSKSLVMIPFRFAIEMVNRGWILRNTIIWYKKSCMPSSVSDRFTIDFEYIFFFSKNQKYYFEQQFEEFKTKPHSPGNKNRIGTIADSNPKERYDDVWGNPQGRNKRTTWTINPKPFPDAHFAVFPPELCETPIKAGCPEYVCKKCGNPKIKVYKTIKKGTARDTSDYAKKLGRPDGGGNRTRGAITPNQRVPKGFESTCDCESDFIPGILLDPFSGAGSALLTARKLGRRFLGIEISQKYIDIAKKRLGSMGRDTNLDEFW